MTLSARAAWLLYAVMEPELAKLAAKGIPGSDQARQMMLAIALQESKIACRDQITAVQMLGPALSFWQFERGGGVVGVLKHPASAATAREASWDRGLPCYDPLHTATIAPASRMVWERMATDDALGAIMARLLLWTDPQRLPSQQDQDGGWAYYLRNWRPGKPHEATWPGHWALAQNIIAA